MLDLLANAASTPTAPSGTGTDALLIGAVVTLGTGLIEAVKGYVAKRNNKNGNGHGAPAACLKCQTNVERTLAIVSHADGNGVPLIYSGHQVAMKLDRVADELASVARKLDKE